MRGRVCRAPKLPKLSFKKRVSKLWRLDKYIKDLLQREREREAREREGERERESRESLDDHDLREKWGY